MVLSLSVAKTYTEGCLVGVCIRAYFNIYQANILEDSKNRRTPIKVWPSGLVTFNHTYISLTKALSGLGQTFITVTVAKFVKFINCN